MLAITILVGTIILSFALSRTLTRPLGQLVKGTKAVAAGNLNAVLHIQRQDEISTLAESFTEMVDALKQRQQEVEHYVSELRTLYELSQMVNQSKVDVHIIYLIRLLYNQSDQGVLIIYCAKPTVNNADTQLALTIAQIISPAIAHAQRYSFTYSQLQQANQRLTLVNQISRHLSSILDSKHLLATVLGLLKQGSTFDVGGVGLVENNELVFQNLFIQDIIKTCRYSLKT